MLYTFDLRRILRRYAPDWFRWPENLSLLFAYCRWLLRIEDSSFAPLRAEVSEEYGYGGLLHGLEWVLNDRFDPVLRRIEITHHPKLPLLHYRDAGEAPVAFFGDAGAPSPYYFLDAATLNTWQPFPFEFSVKLPDDAGGGPQAVFDLLDVYRFAGLRPRIVMWGWSYGTYTIVGIYNYTDYSNG